jgi:hypothetical protein
MEHENRNSWTITPTRRVSRRPGELLGRQRVGPDSGRDPQPLSLGRGIAMAGRVRALLAHVLASR